MEDRSNPGPFLIACGTLIVLAALLLVGFQMSLSADDVRDHRAQSSNLLRDEEFDRVTLSEWQPPSTSTAWMALSGGFVLIDIGLRVTSRAPGSGKLPRADELD
jgi:hypothetical protein